MNSLLYHFVIFVSILFLNIVLSLFDDANTISNLSRSHSFHRFFGWFHFNTRVNEVNPVLVNYTHQAKKKGKNCIQFISNVASNKQLSIFTTSRFYLSFGYFFYYLDS